MKIKYLTILEFCMWDNFVVQHSQGAIFHKSEWLKNHFGEFKILTIQEDSRIIGGFAHLISNKAGVKGIFRPPYTPYFYPLVKEYSIDGNSEIEIEILDLILNELKRYNVSLMFDSNIKYYLPYQNNGYIVIPKLNYIIDPSEFLNKVSKRKRSTINKFNKQSDSKDIYIKEDRNTKEILTLWDKFGKEKSMNTYSSLLNTLFSEKSEFELWGSIRLYSKDKKLLAAGIYVYDERKLYNLIPIVNYKILEKKEKNIGDFLYYCLIKIAERKNLIFDFEGSEVSGVEKMYRRLGGKIDLKNVATKFDYKLRTIYGLNNLYNKIKSI